MSEMIGGLVLPAAAVAPETVLFDITGRTELAVAALGSLGLVADRGAATEHIGERMETLHSHLMSNRRYRPEVGVEPYVAIELSEHFGLDSLIKAFDAGQRNETQVFTDLWSQYSVAELNSRAVGKTGTAEGDKGISGQARAMLLGGSNDYNEAGLYYTGRNLKRQTKTCSGQELVNPADYIVLNAQRRAAGEPLLDKPTFTRFPQLIMRGIVMEGVGADSWVPDGSSSSGWLELDGSDGDAYPGVGVRLSVGSEKA